MGEHRSVAGSPEDVDGQLRPDARGRKRLQPGNEQDPDVVPDRMKLSWGLAAGVLGEGDLDPDVGDVDVHRPEVLELDLHISRVGVVIELQGAGVQEEELRQRCSQAIGQ